MNGRIIWLDNLRGALILLVVLGHTLLFTSSIADKEILYRYISSIWMPLFMFTSGYASGKTAAKYPVIFKRFKQLIVPYVGWSLILGMIQGHNILYYAYHPTESFWFIWALFFIVVLHMLCQKVANVLKFNREIIVFIVWILLNVFLSRLPNTSIFATNLIVLHFLYYSLGFRIRSLNVGGAKIEVLLVLFMLYFFITYYNKGNYVPSFFPIKRHILYDIMDAALGIYVMISFFAKFVNKPVCLLTKIGAKYSLEFYIIHLLVFKIVFSLGNSSLIIQ